ERHAREDLRVRLEEVRVEVRGRARLIDEVAEAEREVGLRDDLFHLTCDVVLRARGGARVAPGDEPEGRARVRRRARVEERLRAAGDHRAAALDLVEVPGVGPEARELDDVRRARGGALRGLPCK